MTRHVATLREGSGFWVLKKRGDVGVYFGGCRLVRASAAYRLPFRKVFWVFGFWGLGVSGFRVLGNWVLGLRGFRVLVFG